MAEAAKKPADKKADKEAPEAKKSPLVMILVVLVAVLVAGGGAAGGMLFWMKSHSPASSSPKAAEAKEEAPKPGAPEIFVPLDPPFVVNFQGDQAVRFLQIAVQVMTHSQVTADLLKLHDPVIKNDLLFLFGGQKVDEMATREGKEKLQAEALEAVRKIVKAAGGNGDSVEALYFTSFVMQ